MSWLLSCFCNLIWLSLSFLHYLTLYLYLSLPVCPSVSIYPNPLSLFNIPLHLENACFLYFSSWISLYLSLDLSSPFLCFCSFTPCHTQPVFVVSRSFLTLSLYTSLSFSLITPLPPPSHLSFFASSLTCLFFSDQVFLCIASPSLVCLSIFLIIMSVTLQSHRNTQTHTPPAVLRHSHIENCLFAPISQLIHVDLLKLYIWIGLVPDIEPQ